MIGISYFPRETYVVWFLICVFKCLCENIGDSMGEVYPDTLMFIQDSCKEE